MTTFDYYLDIHIINYNHISVLDILSHFTFDKKINTEKLNMIYELSVCTLDSEIRVRFNRKAFCLSIININILNFCNFSWRTYNGVCNNVILPYQGAVQTQFSRVLPAVYDDDIYSIRKSTSGADLPSARLVGTHMFEKTDNTNPDSPVTEVMPNNGAVIYGQTIVHDFALQTKKHVGDPGPGIQCCSQNRNEVLAPELSSPGCLAIHVPRDDDAFSSHNVTCLNFIRSQTVPKADCSFSKAEQVNTVTHYIDGSFVYGSSEEQSNSMRTFTDGLFLMRDNILPPNQASTGFTAGDGRFIQTSQLTYFHSIYYREHNRIATRLAAMNPSWDDEHTFQETRRIIGALIQHSTYEEWLPLFVGEEVAVSEGLMCRDTLYCDCYDAKNDGSCINEFTTGPGRLFHLFVPDHFDLIDAEGGVESLRLSSIFGDSSYLENNYEGVARGLMQQHMSFGKFPIELMDFMFRGNNKMGLDLLSMDIQRGRDHGLPPYTSFRTKCGGSIINNFDDLAPVISTEVKPQNTLLTIFVHRALISQLIYRISKNCELFMKMFMILICWSVWELRDSRDG